MNAGINRLETTGRMAELRSAYNLRPLQSQGFLEIEPKPEDER